MIGQGMLARKNIYRTGLIRKEKKKPIDKTQYTTRVFDLKEKTIKNEIHTRFHKTIYKKRRELVYQCFFEETSSQSTVRWNHT